jgi:hypothetical protein
VGRTFTHMQGLAQYLHNMFVVGPHLHAWYPTCQHHQLQLARLQWQPSMAAGVAASSGLTKA